MQISQFPFCTYQPMPDPCFIFYWCSELAMLIGSKTRIIMTSVKHHTTKSGSVLWRNTGWIMFLILFVLYKPIKFSDISSANDSTDTTSYVDVDDVEVPVQANVSPKLREAAKISNNVDEIVEIAQHSNFEDSTQDLVLPLLNPLITLRSRRVMTTFRANPDRFVNNYLSYRQQLRERGWLFNANALSRANMVIVQESVSANQVLLQYRNTMVNNLGFGGQKCLSGTKSAQIKCRIDYSKEQGCDYYDLNIQPAHYRLYDENECRTFFDQVCKEQPEKMWIKKPNSGYHGRKITVHHGCADLATQYGSCKKGGDEFFMMPYVPTALIDGHKFDVRTYMLVARTDPLIVFYHDGFARKASSPYNASTTETNSHVTNARSQDKTDHYYNFERLQEALTKYENFPANYMNETFREHAMKVENFVIQAARSTLRKNPGAFQLYALDWIIDSHGGVHLLECNGDPVVRDYKEMGNTLRDAWDGLMDLVLDLQADPSALRQKGGELTTQPKRFSWKDWHLIFNEQEEIQNQQSYQACSVDFAIPMQSKGHKSVSEFSNSTIEFDEGIDEESMVEDDEEEDISISLEDDFLENGFAIDSS